MTAVYWLAAVGVAYGYFRFVIWLVGYLARRDGDDQ